MSGYNLFDVKNHKTLGEFPSKTKAVEVLRKLLGSNLEWNGQSYINTVTKSEYKLIPIPTITTESYLNSPPQKSNR